MMIQWRRNSESNDWTTDHELTNLSREEAARITNQRNAWYGWTKFRSVKDETE
jgi:hypothetical protein